MDSPNPFSVGLSVVRSLATVRRPRFGRTTGPEYRELASVLDQLQQHGMRRLAGQSDRLDAFLADMQSVRAQTLSRDDALAFWLNVYNAGALRLAAKAATEDVPSVLRIPGAFSQPMIEVDGELLSMDAIEHAKIRRFGDPRIHGALVCGSVSCPTLRSTPYLGSGLDRQLDEQMRSFLDGGGAFYDAQRRTLFLSRVFLWYGSDFVRPRRMPTFVPTRRMAVARALQPWLSEPIPSEATVEFQAYDWGLRCSVG